MRNQIITDGTNIPVIADRDRPIHLSKTRASVRCGLIVTPTMKTSWYEQPKVLDNICPDCQEAAKSSIVVMEDKTEEDTTDWYNEQDRIDDARRAQDAQIMVYVSPYGTKYHRVLHKGMTGEQMRQDEADGLRVERDGKWVALSPCRTKPCFPIQVS